MRARTRLLTGSALVGALLLPAVPASPAGAAPAPRSTPVVDDAVAWLVDQQQPDGGFELAGFPGYETPDAVLALAAAGQTGPAWSEAEALGAVEAVATPEGLDALDAIDDWVDDVQGDPEASASGRAQQAAKVIALVTEPLGLDPTDVDPSADTDAPVDLRAALEGGAGGNGSYGALPLNGRAFALWALAALDLEVPTALVDGLVAAQQPNGSWDYAGDPAGTDFDPDTTAVAALALALAEGSDHPAVRRAVTAFGLNQGWDGTWATEGDDGNPNSTAVTMLLATTLGSDPDGPCWRDAAEPRFVGTPFPSPVGGLERRQAPDGHIVGPFDGFGLTTFGTSQSIQGLAAAEGAWPYRAEASCAAPPLTGSRRVVQAQYVDLLLRPADTAGADFWTARLDGGTSPALQAKQFTGTAEYGRRVVDRLVRTHLPRTATAEEQAEWAPSIVAGQRAAVVAAILGSDEHLADVAFGSEATWITTAFTATVGRPPSDADRTYLQERLDAGVTRTRIARDLQASAEGRGTTVRDLYRQLLRRNPSAADRTYWGDRLRRGTSPEFLVTLIAGAPEYREKAGVEVGA